MPKLKNTTTKKTKTKKVDTKPTTVTFRLEPELRAKLSKLAKAEYTSESALCNRFISQMLQADMPDRLAEAERRIAILEEQPKNLVVYLGDDMRPLVSFGSEGPQDVEDVEDVSDADVEAATAEEDDAEEPDGEEPAEGDEGTDEGGDADVALGEDEAAA